MKLMSRFSGCLALLVGGAVAQAQEPAAPIPPADPLPTTTIPYFEAPRRSGLETESLPSETAEDLQRPPGWQPHLGPTPVTDVRFLMDNLGLARLFGDSGIRAFGWAEGGYLYSNTGSGPLATEPRLPLFGNQFMANQIGLAIQKPLRTDVFDWGFNIRYFAGADAATGQPKGGIDDPPGDARFGQDFRDLNLQFHLPILTDGGLNVKVGRMNSIIGWNGYLAPYRPMYTSDYQFFYSQDGAFTGALTQLVVNDQLDIWNGITMGANTFFTMRSSNSWCYIGQINYWLTAEQRTRLTASVYTGPDAIFAAPGLAGTQNTTLELRIQQNWTERFTQVVQSNMGWDQDTPRGLASWYGVYTVGIWHLNPEWDLIGRGEWFRDVRGTRTGFNTDFSEVTLGVNWHPHACIEIRPEVRGDFAGAPAFGPAGAPTDRSQFTMAISALLKF